MRIKSKNSPKRSQKLRSKKDPKIATKKGRVRRGKIIFVENKNNFFETKNKKFDEKPQKTPFLDPPQKRAQNRGFPGTPIFDHF
jgi:hypothetical protein